MDETKESSLAAEVLYLEDLLCQTTLQDHADYEATLDALERTRKLLIEEARAKNESEKIRMERELQEKKANTEKFTTLASGAFGLIGLALVVGYEHVYPIVSKAGAPIISGIANLLRK